MLCRSANYCCKVYRTVKTFESEFERRWYTIPVSWGQRRDSRVCIRTNNFDWISPWTQFLYKSWPGVFFLSWYYWNTRKWHFRSFLILISLIFQLSKRSIRERLGTSPRQVCRCDSSSGENDSKLIWFNPGTLCFLIFSSYISTAGPV
jgi:hypothetical protein